MRREPLLAALLCAVGAFLLLVAAGRAWVAVQLAATPLLPPQALAVSGSDLLPGLGALGLVGLAGVPALAATRGRGRVVLGAVLLALGAGTAALVLQRVAGGLGASALRTTVVREAGAGTTQTSVTAWPWLGLLGAVLLTAAGLLVAVRGRRWEALGRRYEPPAPREAAPAGERDLWEALDRGDDPTAGDPEGEQPAPRG